MNVTRLGRVVHRQHHALLFVPVLLGGLFGPVACAHQSEHHSSVAASATVAEGDDGLLRDYGSRAEPVYAEADTSSRRSASSQFVEEGAARRPTYASNSLSSAPARDEGPASSEPSAGFEQEDTSTMSVRVFGASNCAVDVSGEARGSAPLNNLQVASGSQTISVRCGRKVDSREVELASGEHQELVFDFGAPAPRAKPKATKRSSKRGSKRRR